MTDYIDRSGLKVAPVLASFIEDEALPGTGIEPDRFWGGLAGLAADFMPRNRQLLAFRDELQGKIDAWHRAHGPVASDPEGYERFLREIGYLVEEPGPFEIETTGLDPEIATLCGPQLVVPVSNARYALNAANARWGSLYDAFYGTDAIPQDGDLAPGAAYNPRRGEAVFARVAAFLDEALPLAGASHAEVTGYGHAGEAFRAERDMADPVGLAHPEQFVGWCADGQGFRYVFKHHGLHIELHVDAGHRIGATHPAGLADVVIESALTTIEDCEDSVTAVDAEDKVGVYRNWLGLMRGTLADTFEKGGRTVHRTLNPDRSYTAPDGTPLVLKGRALLLVRNVGHLMTTSAVLDAEGRPIGEGLLDAAVTTLCAVHDRTNSATGAVYIVKPKMHGPDEVAFACEMFGGVERVLGLKPETIKIGIMDEERRTSANLKAVIHAARQRVFFINTGFLDRTGDEIHTSMEAGPVLRKDEIKAERWLQAYEDRNALIGLSTGFSGRAQIGKGMWAKPEAMAEMLASKIGHPQSGANTAWVPSPTAATLHALHYHAVNVFEAQKRRHNEATPPLAALFSMPALDPATLSRDEITREVENNAQGILGYVVRWVDQGVGCSKVPDINNVALMEDRATCRISSQAIANWLRHGLVGKDELSTIFERMAAVVDAQNAGDPNYRPMEGNFRSFAFQAALDLAIRGAGQPSGYTEPILHAAREKVKAGQ
jgi:malate synthase